jgi:hypothetical protein
VPESLLNFCDVQGLYVIAQAPIDTRRSGESRRKGGNPSNAPEWLGAYLERTVQLRTVEQTAQQKLAAIEGLAGAVFGIEEAGHIVGTIVPLPG